MNPYYYIFYRLNQFTNKKGDNEFGPILLLTFFMGQYSFIIFGKLTGINEMNYSENKPKLFIIFLIIILVNSIVFLNKKRVDRITKLYSKETRIKRRIGGFMVVLFMCLPLYIFFFT